MDVIKELVEYCTKQKILANSTYFNIGLFGALILTQGSAVSPFIYSIF